MKKEEYERLKRYFLIGIIFSAVTVAGGEMPIGWTVYPEAKNELVSNILGFAKLSTPQLACGVLFGSIGIAMQYYGYKAIAGAVTLGGCRKSGKLIGIGAKAIAFWGAVIHVMSAALMFLCRLESNPSMTELPASLTEFAVWLVLPITAVFMVFYIPMLAAMFITVVSGKTLFPRLAAVFNPAVFSVIIGSLPYFAPNVPFVNGVRMSHMGIGSLVTFTALLLLMTKYHAAQQKTR